MTSGWPAAKDTFKSTYATGELVPLGQFNDQADAMTKMQASPLWHHVQRHFYLPYGWDVGWVAAKAAIATRRVGVACLSDSFGNLVASDFQATDWPALLRASLRASLDPTNYADYWPVMDSADFVSAQGGGAAYGGTPPWVVDSTSRSWNVANSLVRGLIYTAGTAATGATFTSPYACTAMDLIYWDWQTGNWKYSRDGAADVQVNVTTQNKLIRLAMTGLANQVHTLQVHNQSAANKLWVDGIVTYKGSTTVGLGFATFDDVGAALYTELNQTLDKARLWQGSDDGTNKTGFGFPLAPDLLIICMGINDCQNGVTTENYWSALVRLVQAVRRGHQDASIILVGQCFPDGVNSDTTPGGTNPSLWRQYLAVQRDVAETYTCAWLNTHAAWGELGGTLGFQGASNFHPLDAGHADIANRLLAVL